VTRSHGISQVKWWASELLVASATLRSNILQVRSTVALLAGGQGREMF
jgi:hypothetical protein